MSQPTIDRLDDQLAWYDLRSRQAQRKYKVIKTLQVIAAAAVPVLAAVDSHAEWILGALGALVVVGEGIQQMNQYQHNWITYRSTAEALKHEKYLFAAGAGPYAAVQDPGRLLAERVEGLVSQEHAKWVATQETAASQEARR